MRCSKCGIENREGRKFCADCGTPIAAKCARCGASNQPGERFCGECGATLGVIASGSSKGAPQIASAVPVIHARDEQLDSAAAEGERRHLTVMFCDLVGSTALSQKLDPEELREVMRAYHETCADVVKRFDGYVAKYLGDGLLIYFGYPRAHEDDAQRAVGAGLGIIEELKTLNLQESAGGLRIPLHTRIGIHTGLVVVAQMGIGEQREASAIVGETPNLAARIQQLADPDTVVIGDATYRLIQPFFACEDAGTQRLKGITNPVRLYRVRERTEVHSRFEAVVRTGLTPLVGRDEELGLLLRQWEQTKTGGGQVALLIGEPGIGKSRLTQVMKEHVERQGAVTIAFRCSPFYQQTAWYPVIEHLERLLQWQREDDAQTKLGKLTRQLSQCSFVQADTMALLAALLSLPQPENSALLNLSPQKQKQRTQEALIAWLAEDADRAPILAVWEDLHWADPSTLELLGLLIDQVPAARLLVLITARPEFNVPWGARSYMTPLMLSRLARSQAQEMLERVTGGKALPTEVSRQIVSKTDGVPLFVEELTKMIVESGLLREVNGHYELTGPLPPLAIPITLQDSLTARLDRLSTAREVAQLGATLGRDFSYELLQAVADFDASTLQVALGKLVEAEVLYQRGLPPHARYSFKHALIQDTAYQSLLKSARQQHHRRVAQVLGEKFVDVTKNQPELIAHHYTEAQLFQLAVPYWQRAGEIAASRSATVEAISHISKALELLATQPDTCERKQQETALQLVLGPVLMAAKGWSAPETEVAYKRASELCQQIGNTFQLFPALYGICTVYAVRPELKKVSELGRNFLSLAQQHRDLGAHIEGHFLIGYSLFFLADLPAALEHLDQATALYGSEPRRELAAQYGHDPGMSSRFFAACALWLLGYPERARTSALETVSLARRIAHPFTLAYAHGTTALALQLQGDMALVGEQAEAGMNLSREQGFPHFLGFAEAMWGWLLTKQGDVAAGIEHLRQGAAGWRSQGSDLWRPYWLALLSEAYGKADRIDEGLAALTEALSIVERTGESFYEAELYRLKGALALRQFNLRGSTLDATNSKDSIADPGTAIEPFFRKAIEVSRRQQAKSLELRATMSLARLLATQGRRDEARAMLADIYGWFTEGFDTADLKDAKALLEELGAVGLPPRQS